MYSRILARLFKSTVKIMGLAVVMLAMNVKLALMSFVMVPVITVAIVTFKNLSRKVHRAIRTRISQLNTFLSENISGMRLIQIFANEQMKYEEFSGKTMDLYKANLKQLFIFAVFRPLIYFLSQIALSIVLIGGGLSVIESTLTVGTLYIFINYISNADYVLTDSFHGTAFSLNFSLQVLSVPAPKYNCRLESILRMTGCEHRMFTSVEEALEKAEKPIDYSVVNEKLDAARQASARYLKEALASQ
jgi:ABC-type multidrug transport system fused ATPase/permease subunit